MAPFLSLGLLGSVQPHNKWRRTILIDVIQELDHGSINSCKLNFCDFETPGLANPSDPFFLTLMQPFCLFSSLVNTASYRFEKKRTLF